MSREVSVVVKFRFEATHKWPQCPFDEVAFLRNKHRHIFHVTAEKVVAHDDRDVEIIMLKRSMLAACDEWRGELGALSCEMVAGRLADRFGLVMCEVLEDGENGARVRGRSDA